MKGPGCALFQPMDLRSAARRPRSPPRASSMAPISERSVIIRFTPLDDHVEEPGLARAVGDQPTHLERCCSRHAHGRDDLDEISHLPRARHRDLAADELTEPSSVFPRHVALERGDEGAPVRVAGAAPLRPDDGLRDDRNIGVVAEDAFELPQHGAFAAAGVDDAEHIANGAADQRCGGVRALRGGPQRQAAGERGRAQGEHRHAAGNCGLRRLVMAGA